MAIATFTSDAAGALHNAALPSKRVALDDALVFHMLLCRRNTAASAASFEVDFDGRGDLWDTRVPQGGGVFVYLRPTSRWYIVEAQGFYLLGGDEIKQGGRWSFDSYLKGCQNRSRPDLSFGNFRVSANWKPSSDAVTWEYDWSDLGGDILPVHPASFGLGKMHFVRDIRYRLMEHKQNTFKVADGSFENELAKKVGPHKLQEIGHQEKTGGCPAETALSHGRTLKRSHDEIEEERTDSASATGSLLSRDSGPPLGQTTPAESCVGHTRQTTGLHAALTELNTELQSALSYSKVQEERDNYKEIAEKLINEHQQRQARKKGFLRRVNEALQAQATQNRAMHNIISELKDANDTSAEFIKNMREQMEKLSNDTETPVTPTIN